MSTQRLKIHGVRVVGCFKGTDVDVLQDRFSKATVELAEEGPTGKKILVLNTVACPPWKNIKEMRQCVDEIRKRNRSAMVQTSELDEEVGHKNNEELTGALHECKHDEFNASVLAFNILMLSAPG
jgi:hypothetical protein